MLQATQPNDPCTVCGKAFLRFSSFESAKVCGAKCAGKVGKLLRKQEAAKTRAQKEALKTRRDYINEAQHAFNRYIRLRDADRPCICCGVPLGGVAVGGYFDCGHYRSIGSAPQLRFDPDNAHGQTKKCNRYGAGRAVDYRLGLIRRKGLAVVERLEADQSSPKWDIPELKAIRDEYRALAKQLEKA